MKTVREELESRFQIITDFGHAFGNTLLLRN